MRRLTLGYSPCPNDTFIFYSLVHGRMDTGGIVFAEVLDDVETLNRMAFESRLDVTKLSFGALGNLREGYCLLRSGGALGRGCGPLVVSRGKVSMSSLAGKKIAIPGENTTAFLLLRLFDPSLSENAVAMRFDEVMGAVSQGEADAGLVIHEGRFTYKQYGLTEVTDLGKWWEEETGLPIPLGCIAARRSLGAGLPGAVESLIRDSVLYALKNRAEPMGYVKAHSQELEDGVIESHISLYVNDFSIDMGEEGIRAVEALYLMAEKRGIFKKSQAPLFFG